ncbi:hypothetical protein BH11PSE11_BH11PSE11_20740 [soil metagenome]
MTSINNRSHSDQSKQNEKKGVRTEADAKSTEAGRDEGDKSSHNQKSHTKAGQSTGAGGGKKQERHH